MTTYSDREVRELLEREEGHYLERKSLWARTSGKGCPLDRRKVRDSIAEYVPAFANADGGDLILGTEDDGEPTGRAYPEEAIEDFFRLPERARHRRSPRLGGANQE